MKCNFTLFEITGVTDKEKGEGTVSSFMMDTFYFASTEKTTN